MGKLGQDGVNGRNQGWGLCRFGGTIIFQTASYCNKLYIKACRVLSSSGIFRFELPCRLGGETLLGKLNVGSLTGRPSEKFAAGQSVKKGYAMKLYALACCIFGLIRRGCSG